MTIIQMLKSAFIQIPNLKYVKDAAFSKVILFLLGATVILAVPTTLQVNDIFQDFQRDSQKIAQKIPNFTIENGQLATSGQAEGFIYQTNSIIFTFDPEGKRNAIDIASDATASVLSIGLLKDEIVISFPGTGFSSSFLDTNQLKLSYSEPVIKNLDGKKIRESLSSNQIPWWLQLIVFLIALYPAFLNLLITLIMGTFVANIYTKLKLFSYSFFENLKILIVSAALPTILSVLIQLFVPSFDATTFILFAALFLFAQGVKGSPKIQLKN
ncbi:DUF1189 domain-containing protein [Enterococcus gallinarum]|uniref:DUF1189 domain-containing protein n=1 Tax=Enterococcus gallinarum TaxID=1353 RepID=UPI001AD6128A|nr:DUF1189 domain-containing protein [Enterococcus gallinarum]MBO6326305.1 DUF1189 domain-containing protein [Enterococcus gallinarum]